MTGEIGRMEKEVLEKPDGPMNGQCHLFFFWYKDEEYW